MDDMCSGRSILFSSRLKRTVVVCDNRAEVRYNVAGSVSPGATLLLSLAAFVDSVVYEMMLCSRWGVDTLRLA